MIKVNRISHAGFDTPDLEAQVEHYTRVMGLTLVDREKDAAYLSTGADHHTLVPRSSPTAGCRALGFQLPPGTDLGLYAKQIEAHGIKTRRLSDSQPNISDVLAFEDTKGTRMEVFVEAVPSGVGFRPTGISPNKLGHVAFCVTDANAAVNFYCDVLGFKVSDWMGAFLPSCAAARTITRSIC